jgi:hypothetical protein
VRGAASAAESTQRGKGARPPTACTCSLPYELGRSFIQLSTGVVLDGRRRMCARREGEFGKYFQVRRCIAQ